MARRVTRAYATEVMGKLTERDKKIILCVYEQRFLRLDQLQRLFFKSIRATQRRLKTLYELRFLSRTRLAKTFGEGTSQYVYSLDEAGAYFIASQRKIERGDLRWKKKRNLVELMFLEHTLAVNEIYVRLKEAEKDQECKLLEWVSEREFQGYFWKDIGKIRPDAYFKLEVCDPTLGEPITYDYFVEVDLGTMRLKSFAAKIQKYVELFLSEEYRSWFTFYPTILIVSSTEQRLRTLKKTTEKVLKQSLCREISCLFTSLERFHISLLT